MLSVHECIESAVPSLMVVRNTARYPANMWAAAAARLGRKSPRVYNFLLVTNPNS